MKWFQTKTQLIMLTQFNLNTIKTNLHNWINIPNTLV